MSRVLIELRKQKKVESQSRRQSGLITSERCAVQWSWHTTAKKLKGTSCKQQDGNCVREEAKKVMLIKQNVGLNEKSTAADAAAAWIYAECLMRWWMAPGWT